MGYIGLGAMGGSLARHLIGSPGLAVYDRSPHALSSFGQLGVETASSAETLAARSDTLIICLPRSSDVEDLLFGENGIADKLTPGTLVIDQTSGEPALTSTMAGRLQERGVLYMDAPVSGGIPAAQNRMVTIIASGPEAAWVKGETTLRLMSTKVTRCGSRVGDGQALKLITNGIGACYRLTSLEVAALWRRFGLPLDELVSALNAGPGANFTTRNMLVGLVEGRATTNFGMSLMVKDLNGAIELAETAGAASALIAAARGLMQATMGVLGAEARLEDVVPFTEKLSGVSLRPENTDTAAALSSSVSPAELAALLTDATTACNVLAVLEGARIGQKYGLELDAIARVIDMGSAWSAVAPRVIDALAKNVLDPQAFAVERQSLVAANRLARKASLPFLMPQLAASLWQSVIGE